MATNRKTTKNNANIDIASLFQMNIGVPTKHPTINGEISNYDVLTQAYIFTDNEKIEVRFLDKEMAKFNFTAKNPDEFCFELSKILVTSCLPEKFKGEHLKQLFHDEYKTPQRRSMYSKYQELIISFDIVHNTSHNMYHVNNLKYLFVTEKNTFNSKVCYKPDQFYTYRDIKQYYNETVIKHMDNIFNPATYPDFNVNLADLDMLDVPFYEKIKIGVGGKVKQVLAYDLASKEDKEKIDLAIKQAKDIYSSNAVNRWLSPKLK